MRNVVDGRYLYGFDDVFWKDGTYAVRIREKKIEEFLNRDKSIFH